MATDPLREALRTIAGPASADMPYMDVYRAAGGGYEGLQAVATSALAASSASVRDGGTATPLFDALGDVVEGVAEKLHASDYAAYVSLTDALAEAQEEVADLATDRSVREWRVVSEDGRVRELWRKSASGVVQRCEVGPWQEVTDERNRWQVANKHGFRVDGVHEQRSDAVLARSDEAWPELAPHAWVSAEGGES